MRLAHFPCFDTIHACILQAARASPPLEFGAIGMESTISYLGVAGSAVSMLTTMYFWFVRMRKEQPCLKPYIADKEFFLGLGRADVRQIGFKLGVIVANYSVLPNAILGVRLWIRLQSGWQEVGHLAFDKQTPQPFNVPPMQTVLLRLTGTLSFPYQDALEKGSATLTNYLTTAIAQPLEMKLELRHLHHHAETHVLTVPAEAGSYAPGARSLSPAA
jgi:hypothetical protein